MDELLKQYGRTVALNIKLQIRVDALEARIKALETRPTVEIAKIEAMDKKIDEMILNARVKR